MTAPHGTPQGYRPTTGAPDAVSDEDRSMAMLAHLSTLASMVLSVGALSFVGPLVVWFLYKDRSRFVRESAAGAFNFNLSMWAAVLIGGLMCATLVLIPVGLPIIGIALLAQVVLHIIGAVKANKGEHYDYPMTFVRVLS